MASHLVSSGLILLTIVIAYTHGQIVFSSGNCPVVSTQPAFDLSQYLGKWYEYERFENWFEVGVVCGTATYGNRTADSITVVNGGLREIKVFGSTVYRGPTNIEGTATIPNPVKPAELRVSFSKYDNGGTDPNYFLVETDYTGYAVIFSCSNLPVVSWNIQFAWILTRQPGVAPANLAAIKSNLESFGIDTNNFGSVRQTDC